MVFLGSVKNTHTTVVGADIVQCLHPFQGIAEGLSLSQCLAVNGQRLL